MKEKNYNLELIRMISFVLVIAIHVSNYFCRAYGEIPNSEYAFSLVVDTAARVSVPSFYDFRGVAAGKRGDTEKALQKDLTLFVGIGCMERGLLSVEYLLYENRSKTAGNYFCSCGGTSLVPVCYDTDLSGASVSAGYVQKPVEES